MLTLNHFAIPVHKGKMDETVKVLETLGFRLSEYEVNASWGKARFLKNSRSFNKVQLQLTEYSDPLPRGTFKGVHVAINAKSIEKVGEALTGFKVNHEITQEVPGKWFVSIPELTPVKLEVIKSKPGFFAKYRPALIMGALYTFLTAVSIGMTGNLLEGMVIGIIAVTVALLLSLGILIIVKRLSNSW